MAMMECEEWRMILLLEDLAITGPFDGRLIS